VDPGGLRVPLDRGLLARSGADRCDGHIAVAALRGAPGPPASSRQPDHSPRFGAAGWPVFGWRRRCGHPYLESSQLCSMVRRYAPNAEYNSAPQVGLLHRRCLMRGVRARVRPDRRLPAGNLTTVRGSVRLDGRYSDGRTVAAIRISSPASCVVWFGATRRTRSITPRPRSGCCTAGA